MTVNHQRLFTAQQTSLNPLWVDLNIPRLINIVDKNQPIKYTGTSVFKLFKLFKFIPEGRS